MEQTEQLINIYQTGFYTCLVVTILLFLLTVFFFFMFDIRGIFNAKTGRTERKTIEKLKEVNEKTGQLRQEVLMHTPSALVPNERIALPETEKIPREEVAMYTSEKQEANNFAPETTMLSQSMRGNFVVRKTEAYIHTEEVIE